MYLYQKNNEYYAQISDGMEELGASELTKAGATDVNINHRVISFNSNKETLYKIIYTSRLFEVLAPLISFQVFDTDNYFEKNIYKVGDFCH
jgi:23S rRNA G2445 N2-methylase RlmL